MIGPQNRVAGAHSLEVERASAREHAGHLPTVPAAKS